AKPFFLFVGTLEKRKNFSNLIQAFLSLEADADLVLIGNEGFGYEEVQTTLASHPSKDRVKRLGFLTEEDLAHFYSACEIFLFPSLEEGYGIPIIEAMACGAPVLTSDTTSMPEVANNHGWLVNPSDLSEIVSTIKEIMKNSSVRETRRLQGQA